MLRIPRTGVLLKNTIHTPETTPQNPILLSIFDKIKKRLGLGKNEEKTELPTESAENPPQHNDEWSGCNTGQQRGYPQTTHGYPTGYPHYPENQHQPPKE